jgi:transcriptional regulator with XRE-family HTH domain
MGTGAASWMRWSSEPGDAIAHRPHASADCTKLKIEIDKNSLKDKLYFMPKVSKAILSLTPATLSALETLGGHLAVARTRRRESLAVRAKRIGVSVPTLSKMENGDPTVSMGAFAQALWLIGRDGELARIAAPEFDRGALELSVIEAVALGRRRAARAHKAHNTRVAQAGQSAAQALHPNTPPPDAKKIPRPPKRLTDGA